MPPIGEPAAPPYGRRHDAWQPVAGHATILSSCHCQVPLAFQPLTGVAGGCPGLSGLSGVPELFVAGAQPDGLPPAFFYGLTLNHAKLSEWIAYARTSRKFPTILSADEVVHFLEAVPFLYCPNIARMAARPRPVMRGSLWPDASRISLSQPSSLLVTGVPRISTMALAVVSPNTWSSVKRNR